jgi:pre-mRNA-splicing factor CDC5/CEF1
MKYGLNQWARISSLLVRKSPKQCKARWYDWLDPSIKKTEWTREEDEKLLHLAKLLPTQWRTIAPVVGRTPAQCLERYERLLDLAVGGDEEGVGSRRGADDPRRLRPGEIDPHPEAKPARPDAVDMDEDEREMLAEARARLANTKGKKAKRKAREKALEEARRLASLQKARELKAAGLEAAQAKSARGRARGIDHNAEVAFERRAPMGLHDTSAEDLRAREMARVFRPVTREELEGPRRRDAEEAAAQRDLKRQKLADERDARALAARVNEGGGGAALLEGRRGRMMLPAPQVGDAEMDAIARMAARAGAGAGAAAAEEAQDATGLLGPGGGASGSGLGGSGGGAGGGGVLSSLLGPSGVAGSLRTPRAEGEGGRDALLVQARNLAVARGMQTPLVGGDNPEELQQMGGGGGGGVGGAALPSGRAAIAATPNPLAAAAAPFAAARGRGGLVAPSSVRGGPGWGGGGGGMGGAAVGPGATPLSAPRDALGLNAPSDEAMMMLGGGGGLRAGFASLPAPANQYAVAVPDEEEEEVEDDDGAVPMEEDAEEAEARARREAEARRARELLRRSAAVQRGLPRPTAAAVEAAAAEHAPHRRREASKGKGKKAADEGEGEGDEDDEAAALVAAEYAALVAHDASAFPVGRDGRADRKAAAALPRAPAPAPGEPIALEQLRAAAALVAAEAEEGNAAAASSARPSPEQLAAALALADARLGPLVWIPSRATFESEASLLAGSAPSAAEALRAAFEATRLEMERQAHRAAKLERRAAALATPSQDRAEADARAARAAWDAAAKARLDGQCFAALLEQEQRAAPDRVAEAKARLARAARREAALQRKYAALRSARDQLLAAAAAAAAGK